ncbi:penicillin acylase family protein [Streptomyces sp. LX-29]|uniref:penicillin acylase family protein n=1 Tax=Streptomyces sp. LX-29 TaxID=2900152 RepID=UPI00240D8286|nr:penicillin acylase family protein [Streptomyces sp. LX-29]WFB07759.1 penicillin acylase family protein [Streptomyces sp. LX-29]
MPANENGPSRKKKGRRVRLLVIAVVLLLVAGVGYGTYWSVSTVRASFPETTGTLQLKGLSGKVQVKRDGYGIPQIYADTPEDLFRAQGYVQAQDRFWEMDVRRHMTAGRLSEMFGEDQVETDAFLRTLGWHRVAQQEYDKKLSASTKKYLQAYSDGVNAYLKDHQGKELSVEYAALDFVHEGYKPEKWTPIDSVAWLKAMAWDLRGNMQDEIDRALASNRLSRKQIEQLYPSYPVGRNKPIVDGGSVDTITGEFDPKGTPPTGAAGDAQRTPGTDVPGTTNPGTPAGTPGTAQGTTRGGTQGTNTQGADQATQTDQATQGVQTQLSGLSKSLEEVPALLGPNGSGIGSNSWVVSGAHTTTGKPLLANDPHLAPQLPSVWYQMGLHCNKVSQACPYDVAGFTFSGMPGVVIGHNKDISWGMTNLGADVTDLYLEKVTANTYLFGDKQKPFKVRKETIKVAGGKDRTITVRSTRNGPLVSDRDDALDHELDKVGENAPVGNVAPDRGDGYAVALRWTALEPSKTMDAVFQLNTAKNFSDFRKAARDFAVPSQNLIYADTEGHIGYQAPGRIPIRGNGKATGPKPDGRYPAPGWDPDYQWTGYVPQDAMPWDYDPKRGYIVTANQAVIDQEKYPYLLTNDWGYGARSQRITDLIKSKIKDNGKISMGDMQSMQMDSSSEIAELLTPLLLKIDIKDDYVREAQQLLEGWDYTQDSDSAAAAYFNAVWRNTLMLAFGNKLPKEMRVEGQCLRVRPADDSGPAEDLDGNTRTVRECGQRDADSAQPDGGDRWYEVVRSILDDEKNEWWKTSGTKADPGATNRDELLAKAMKDARYELTAKLGKDIDGWSWGRLHRLTLKNQTMGKEGPGAVQWLLNRGPWNLSGGEAAVNATGWNAAGGYEVSWVPSMRMVVNLQEMDKSLWINLTGASGHAYHDHYTDQTDKWAKGELLPWAFSKKAVDEGTEDELELTP